MTSHPTPPTPDHECGTLEITKEGSVVTKGLTYLHDCGDGCCSTYRCNGCEKTFRVEFPA
jgi:hypothetical protein